MNALNQCVWNELVGPEKFYAHAAHLQVVEESCGDTLTPLYVIVKHEEEPVAALYFQLLDFHFSNALKNFRSEHRNWSKQVLFQILRLFGSSKIPLLQSGNVFFTGDNGIYIKEGIPLSFKESILTKIMEDDSWRNQLPRAAKAFMISNLCDHTRMDGIDTLKFHDLETEPDLWMDIPPEWQDFSDYLSALSSKYRVRANKVFEKSHGLKIQDLSEEQITATEPILMQLYRNVANHAAFNMTYLGENYFLRMKQLYGGNMVIRSFTWKDQTIGFSSGFVSEGIYHLHFIGMDYKYNESLSLYHRMLFEFVRDAIELSCSRIHFGRTATEIKTTIGAIPESTHAYLKMQSTLINHQLPRLLKNFGATPYIQRHPFRSASQK
jgi:hypothetical protein